MGTRGAFGFIKNGKEKVTYNHFDSYPDGLGCDVLKFTKKYADKLNEIYDRLILIDESTDMTEEQRKYCNDMGVSSSNVSTGVDWYSALRGAQSEGIMMYGEGLKYMIDSQQFLLDSLFCEWAYIINLDNNTLEFYRGFNEDPSKAGRYASKGGAGGYYGIALIGEMPLDKIESAEITSKDNDEGDWVTTLKYEGGSLIFE